MREAALPLRGIPPIVLATPAPITHRTAEENLGLGYLASILRSKGANVQIIDGWLGGLTSDEIVDSIARLPVPLWIGFSCYRSNMARAIEVMQLLGQRGLQTPTIAGGYGPTFHPDEFLNAGFDVVVLGEAEETVCELSEHFAFGKLDLSDISGISYKHDGKIVRSGRRPAVANLDAIPFPSRDTIRASLERRSAVHVLSSRGCAAHCTFCSIVAFAKVSHGSHWRQRSIEKFVDELEQVSRLGATCFKVIDDSLIEPPRDELWCRELADDIQSRGLRVRLRGSIRADRVTDEAIRQLKRAGFFAFSCGIENYSESALKRMAKSASVDQNLQALDVFEKHGIYVQAGHILFDHGTTMEELRENHRRMSDYVWTISKGIFSEMYAAEGTPFTRLLRKRNLIDANDDGTGNRNYRLADEDVVQAYTGLKRWHKSHLRLYDKAIDAISAPKALEDEELVEFHALATELRRHDLAFMELLLDSVESGAHDVDGLVDAQVAGNKIKYQTLATRVDHAYASAGLVYDADANPFFG
ncbi:radical SAM protein [Bradyrhizobium sp. I1.7.5]|uniref:B12-binding domain-containing radical SAM protein n=1 Tax=Bradyrhizobium sp. I1.7.5 TaxID=3156363 RepID=UPI003397A253